MCEKILENEHSQKLYSTLRKMDFFENRYYNINRVLMYVIGIWPYQNSKRTLRIILSYTILTVTTIVLIAKFTTTKYDVDLLVDIFTFLIPNLCYYSGYCTCHYNMRKIKKLFDMIKFDWGELKNPEEMAIIKKYATKSKNYTIILTVIFIGFFFIFIVIYLLPHLLNVVVPLNQPRKSKSFPIETFFKIEDSIYGLVLIFFIIASLGVIALAAYGSFLLFIQHACGMLNLTGFILEHVFIDSEQCIYNNNENEMIYKSIIRSIRFHIRTLKFIDFIKDISEECYTIQISLVLILIASDYLKFMQIKKEISENIDDAIICIIHIIGIMFSLFINCHAGQQIIDHSNYVFHKAKVIPWYLVSKKIQKSAIIILMRSQKSCYLEVGRTFISSYEFFVLVLKTSMSYATLKELLEQIKFDWMKLETEQERKIFQKYAKETLILFGFLNAISFLTLSPVLLNVIVPLNESRIYEIPFPVEVFFDTTKTIQFCSDDFATL
ncbi:hypothetical protein HZH66_000990 [Vespula vulgaris]|uniref:Odorant receptor n=1 Tax=Vespula vulgaris TaxID=7454 RepID=A0A834KVK9_VESVU|nr:hypothetical protein HZH66_000990 [Vespula vulgaris]